MSAKQESPGPRKLLRLTECNARQKWKITQPDIRKLRRLRRRMDDAVIAYKDFERELLHRLELWSPIQHGTLALRLTGGIEVKVYQMQRRPPGRDPVSGRFSHDLFSDQPPDSDDED